jgi:hypothetical protein
MQEACAADPRTPSAQPAATVAGQCAALFAPPWHPIVGHDGTPPPETARPRKGVAFLEKPFGTCVVRATEHDVEPPRGFARTDYSRRQAFNADESRFFTVDNNGTWHLYDALSLAYLGPLQGLGGDAEPQWHATDPKLLYYIPRNGVGMRLLELNIVDQHSRVVADFGERLRTTWPTAASAWTRSEGSPSADLRYWALQVDDAAWKGLGIFTYDLQTDTILATYDFARNGKSRPDHLSMSPTGKFVVVSWDEGPQVFTRALTGGRMLAKKGEHSDIALDSQGEDTYVSVDYEKMGAPVYMTNLRTGERTDLFSTYIGPTATAMHFSGKAYRNPGWVVVSTYADYDNGGRIQHWLGRGGYQWLHRKVLAVELRADPAIVPLAFHHSTFAKYFTEPHASTNRDMTRILFNSNWGTTSELDIDAYLVVLPRRVTH